MAAPAEFRSTVGAVKTNLPGVEFGGVFPEMAKVADQLAVVRSFAHTNSGHGGGTHWVMTGYHFPPADNGMGQNRPGMGSIMARYRGANNPATGLPNYVRLGGILGVLFSVPLHRSLIIEQGLAFPEGKAAAEVLAAGDNPERLKTESTFAKLCGVSPLDASSGKQQRHRLNWSGDRQANSALWHIVFTRMVCDPKTQHYIERRMKEGRTKKEAIRCLKRYVAREVFAALPRSQFALDSP